MEINIVPRNEFVITMPIEHIVDDINKVPIKKRIKVIGKILSDVQLNDRQNLTEEDRVLILDYLAGVYAMYNERMETPKPPKRGLIATIFKLLKL